MTDRLITCAARLSEADYLQNPGYGHGSIHDLLFHLLRTDQAWRLGLETGKQLPPLAADSCPTLELLRAGFAQEQAAWEHLLGRLSPEEIEGSIDLANRHGAIFTFSRLAHPAAPDPARHAAPRRDRPIAHRQRTIARQSRFYFL